MSRRELAAPLRPGAFARKMAAMELFFLIALLFIVVWLNRGLFGFGGQEWIGADEIGADGSRKWVCDQCQRQTMTEDGAVPPKCGCTARG